MSTLTEEVNNITQEIIDGNNQAAATKQSTEQPTEAAPAATTVQPAAQQVSQAAEASATPQQKQPIFNYKLGTDIDPNATDKQRGSLERSNIALENLVKLYSVNPNPDDSQIEAAIGENMYDFNRNYGDANANWGAFFGSSFGRVPASTRQAAKELVAKYNERNAAQQAEERTAAELEHEAKYKVKVGDSEFTVDKAFSDNIKTLGNALFRVASSVTQDSTPEEIQAAKTEQQNIINQIRTSLIDKGFPIPPLAEGEAMPSSIQELIMSVPNYADQDALEEIIELAGSREEYKESPADVIDQWRERQALQAELDLMTANRDVERRRMRTGLSGLAATIGDVIRASKGAAVNPRDWSETYNNLSNQERANIDNYRVRLRKLQDDARAERLAELERAAAAREAQLAAQLEYDKMENDLEKARIAAQARVKDAEIKAAGGVAKQKEANKKTSPGRARTNIAAFGKNYFIESSHNSNTQGGVAGILEKHDVSLGIKSDVVGLERASERGIRAMSIIQSAKQKEIEVGGKKIKYWSAKVPTTINATGVVVLSDECVKEIQKYLNDISNYENHTTTPTSTTTSTPADDGWGTVTTDEEQDEEQDKVYDF